MRATLLYSVGDGRSDFIDNSKFVTAELRVGFESGDLAGASSLFAVVALVERSAMANSIMR